MSDIGVGAEELVEPRGEREGGEMEMLMMIIGWNDRGRGRKGREM